MVRRQVLERLKTSQTQIAWAQLAWELWHYCYTTNVTNMSSFFCNCNTAKLFRPSTCFIPSFDFEVLIDTTLLDSIDICKIVLKPHTKVLEFYIHPLPNEKIFEYGHLMALCWLSTRHLHTHTHTFTRSTDGALLANHHINTHNINNIIIIFKYIQ